jgi:uncharacterized repeat protein (TIGR01451 family)
MVSWGASVAWGDYDNDGDLDILLTGDDGSNYIAKAYRNEDCPDLLITKRVAAPAAGPGQAVTANPGDPITYTLVFTNAGAGPATGVVITDSIPVSVANTSVISSGVGITQTNVGVMTYTWAAQNLGVGRGGVITITGVLSTGLPGGHTFTNTARIACTEVESDTNNSSAAEVTTNNPPVANAGTDQFVVPSDAVLLDGSGSTDPDGHLPLTYRWKRTGGPFVILIGADTDQAAFQAPPYQSVLTFTLTVTDALGLGSSPDTVIVYVGMSPPLNQPPYMPSNPTPLNGATCVPLTQTLSWQGGDPDGHSVTYTIALGTSEPPPVIATTTLTSYTPALTSAITYYWGITASDGISTSVGPTWRFTTVGFKYIYLPLVLRQ